MAGKDFAVFLPEHVILNCAPKVGQENAIILTGHVLGPLARRQRQGFPGPLKDPGKSLSVAAPLRIEGLRCLVAIYTMAGAPRIARRLPCNHTHYYTLPLSQPRILPRHHRQAGGLCGARGLRSALGRSTPSFPLSGSSAERTASQRAPSTHMPWTAIPVGHHTDLPPAVIPIDSIIPGSQPLHAFLPNRHTQFPNRHTRPRPGISGRFPVAGQTEKRRRSGRVASPVRKNRLTRDVRMHQRPIFVPVQPKNADLQRKSPPPATQMPLTCNTKPPDLRDSQSRHALPGISPNIGHPFLTVIGPFC